MKKTIGKSDIIAALHSIVDQRIELSRRELDSIATSKESETKSSAGDKYETGMAMLQLEEQKAHFQLSKANELKKALSLIQPEELHEKIQLGSLVQTTNGLYFLSIGLGQVKVDEHPVYVLSITSPIGLQMKGKTKGEKFVFQDTRIQILAVE